ncbi:MULTISPECIES: hypothetical protein [unclassified Rhizobacter]|uniref:hypothetical protein n=1 Tax=unclassified Rhizobacter TaxID=2640088 RepID=UPI0012FC77C8|nr:MULTISPECIES: hypothetical protein [unclassified Rhizobacter]
MRQATATVLGFCAASAVPAAWLAVTSPLGGEFSLQSIAGTFIVLSFFSTLATCVLGLPAFLLLQRWNLVSWWSASLAGLGVGAVAAMAMRLPGPADPADLLTFSLLGGVAAVAFWAVWRVGRSAPVN